MSDPCKEDLKAALQKRDKVEVATKAQEYLDLINNVPLNIAITGESGSGKSSLVNALRGIKNNTPGAAPTGAVETTMEPTEYTHPQNPKIKIWDLPGIGTTKFPAAKYLKHVGFEKYDFFIIVSNDRFRENDAKLAKEIKTMKKNFYFVRSKIDNTIRDEKESNPNLNVKELLQVIRNKCTKELVELGIKSPKVFLVSSLKLHLYEFRELSRAFMVDLSELQREILLLSLPNIDLEIIELKVEVLRGRIKWYVLASVTGAVVPVPGVSEALDLGMILAFTAQCATSLGLTPASLQRLSEISGVPLEDLKKDLESPLSSTEITIELLKRMLSKSALYIAAIVLEEGARFIPGIGIPFAMTLSGSTAPPSVTRDLPIFNKTREKAGSASGRVVEIQICGVRGTFPTPTSRSVTTAGTEQNVTENKSSVTVRVFSTPRGSEMGKPRKFLRLEKTKHKNIQQRHHKTSKAANKSGKLGGSREKLPQNGAASSGGETAGSAVKPLRKNSLTGDAGQEFIIENRFLYYLFTFGTELGNELFYITFFPFVLWNIDALVGRRIIMLWAWVMYFGQCTKDLLGWSRPASPPVVKVEMFYNSEYSMPSTHAMSGTAIPFALFYMTYGRWEYPFALGLSVALSWCVLVCVSRIYMGMHSLLDVLAGVLYSSLILLVSLPNLDWADSYILHSRWSPPLVVAVPFVLSMLCFFLDAWSTSRGDTAQIVGTGAGVALASHVNQRLGFSRDPAAFTLTFPSLSVSQLLTALVRVIAGVAVLVLTRAVMKAVTLTTLCRVLRLGGGGGDVRKARQHMEVELPYRYIVYGTLGFNVLFLVPLLFSYVQL
ncbi:hypothetical protein WMY93_016545 [Mugilogobius chulae]|uniref:IRG-type G domain-containing protein n=1 Tax=Mugilogobius chulae TaxID=88201 RepID=A0AAW0NLW9_9GOBI